MPETAVVTGGAGHIGSHVVDLLVARGDRVIVLDNYSTGLAKNHNPGAQYRRGDTVNIKTLVPEIPKKVFHLGEYARITPSIRDHEQVFMSNTIGTQAVIQYCLDSGAKLIYAGSSTKFAQNGRCHLDTPYALSKAQNVEKIMGYGLWANLVYAICYFSNAFGGREQGEGPYATTIAKFKNQFLRGEPITVVRPGTQSRNFTFVEDSAKGMVMVGDHGEGDGYALYNRRRVSFMEVAQAFGSEIKMIDGYPGRPDSGTLPNRSYDELGWAPKVDILPHIEEFVLAHAQLQVA